MRYRISGVPGAGKTTWIVNKINELLDNGISPNEIFCISFSKAAVEELSRRLNNKLKYVKTLHSVCMYASRRFPNHNVPFIKQCNLNVTMGSAISNFDPYGLEKYLEKEVASLPKVYECMKCYEYMIYNKWLEYKDYEEILSSIDDYEVKYILLKYLQQHKIPNKITDFMDTVIYTYEMNTSLNELYNKKFKYVFIDESQDFTELEHKLVNQLIRNIDNVYFIGDEDQSIYSFKGSNCNLFLADKYDHISFLDTTYRCPSNIIELAKKIRKRMKYKDCSKNIESKKEPGEITYNILDETDITKYLIDFRNENNGSMFVLFRFNSDVFRCIMDFLLLGYKPKVIKSSNKYIRESELILSIYNKTKTNQQLTRQEWAVSNKYINLSRYKSFSKKYKEINTKMYELISSNCSFGTSKLNKLLKIKNYLFPQDIDIHIDTMHASKGTEADNIIIVETWDKSHIQAMINDKTNNLFDSELKLMYVAVTRSKKYLEFVIPNNKVDVINQIANGRTLKDILEMYDVNKKLQQL
jgi:DNA helicase-2/ATP-dependent DNA helicase PcrA